MAAATPRRAAATSLLIVAICVCCHNEALVEAKAKFKGGGGYPSPPPVIASPVPPLPSPSPRAVPPSPSPPAPPVPAVYPPKSSPPEPYTTGGPVNLDVWILAGQSNMAGGNGGDGLPMPANALPFPGKALQYNPNAYGPGTWGDAQPSQLCTNISPPGCMNVTGPELSFARAMINELGVLNQIGFIHAAQGGKSMAVDFAPPNGDMYTAMVADVTAGMAALGPGGRLRGMLLVQGEADSNDLPTALAWPANFENFLNASRAEFARYTPDLPVLMAVQSVRVTAKGKYQYSDIVRAEQQNITLPNLLKTDLLGLEFRVGGTDCDGTTNCVVHLSKDGQMALGEMFAYRWALATYMVGW